MRKETQNYKQFLKRNKVVVGQFKYGGHEASAAFYYNGSLRVIRLTKCGGKFMANNDEPCLTVSAAVYWHIKNNYILN